MSKKGYSREGEQRGDERVPDVLWYAHYFTKPTVTTANSERSEQAMRVVREAA